MKYQALALIFVLFFAVVLREGKGVSFSFSPFAKIRSGMKTLIMEMRGNDFRRYEALRLLGSAMGAEEHAMNGLYAYTRKTSAALGAALTPSSLRASSRNDTLSTPLIPVPAMPAVSEEGDSAPSLAPPPTPRAPNACASQELAKINAKSFLVQDLDRRVVFASRHVGDRWPIASLTKVMTAVVAAESMDRRQEIPVTEKAARLTGDVGGLKYGDLFSLDDFLRAMFVSSSNRAAQAVAEAGGESDFVRRMNAKAAALGMRETLFTEPTGLSFLNQGTARDLMTLAEYTLRVHPELLALGRDREVSITELKTGENRPLATINYFAGKENFLGGKTGYTDEAKRNFLGVFRVADKTVISVVLGSEDAFRATEALVRCAAEYKK